MTSLIPLLIAMLIGAIVIPILFIGLMFLYEWCCEKRLRRGLK